VQGPKWDLTVEGGNCCKKLFPTRPLAIRTWEARAGKWPLLWGGGKGGEWGSASEESNWATRPSLRVEQAFRKCGTLRHGRLGKDTERTWAEL